MKTRKQLQAIFDESKGDNVYITFETFEREAKKYIKLLRTTNTICAMRVSKSGTVREFNFPGNLNLVFNVCNYRKRSYNPVRVSGCGMDMHWHLKLFAADCLLTKAEIEKWGINSACSGGQVL